MSVYRSSAGMAPDNDFEPGTLRHLVPRNRGRLLDPRRTPITVVEVRPDVGFVDVRIEDFEDAGATWEVPLEEVDHYQFEAGAARAGDHAVAEMRAAIERFDRPLEIEARAQDLARTEQRIEQHRAEADRWLGSSSRFLATGRPLPDPTMRRGDPLLAADLETYLREHDLWAIESAFATRFVSNPRSGETVKGHRIVLAELGLADYGGSIVRDPATFAGDWSRDRRADHVLARLGFVRALFGRHGIDEVSLWRGVSAGSPLEARRGRTFVSASFDEVVARSLLEGGADRPVRALHHASVPVEQLFMTYHETSAMNDRFHEAEAVILDRPDGGWP